MTEQEFQQYIEMSPLRGQEPLFRNTNIRVIHIIDDLAQGMDIEQILSEHKDLNKQHIQATFIYVKKLLDESKEYRLYAMTGIFSFWRFLPFFRKRKI